MDMPSATARQLARADVFSGFPIDDLEAIAVGATPRAVDPPAVLYQQGHRVTRFLLVLSGGIKLVRRCPNKRMATMDFALNGATLAIEALFLDGRHTATALVRQPTRLIEISAARFLEQIEQKPELGVRLLSYLSGRMLRLMVHAERLSAYSAEEKLAAYLLEHVEEQDPRHRGQRLPLRRKDLASLLAISPETLCRTLGKLREAGWIAMRDGRVSVSGRQELEQVLNRP